MFALESLQDAGTIMDTVKYIDLQPHIKVSKDTFHSILGLLEKFYNHTHLENPKCMKPN